MMMYDVSSECKENCCHFLLSEKNRAPPLIFLPSVLVALRLTPSLSHPFLTAPDQLSFLPVLLLRH